MNIWVMGEIGTNADKHIEWMYTWPNFADFDILILNLNSLYKATLESENPEKIEHAKQTIIERVHNGGIVIVITSLYFTQKNRKYGAFDNYCLSPISVSTKEVPEGSGIQYDEKHIFATYLKHVKKFHFIIDSFSYKTSDHTEYTDCPVKDKAGHYLGSGYRIGKGVVILLPPVTEISTKDAINKIIEQYRKPKTESKDPAPDWVSRVDLFGLKEINDSIHTLNQTKSKLEVDLAKKLEEKNNLENYYGLLYLQNSQLENCVKNALILLGFNETRRSRSEELEDWVIDFQTIKGVDHGVIEVKGRNEKTTQADIVQCNKWVDDYHLMTPSKNTKGIFITNQFRLESYPESKTKRTKFEPNELNYAKGREICIIPTYVLFEAVNNALGGKKRSREEIEKLIFETNGVLKEI